MNAAHSVEFLSFTMLTNQRPGECAWVCKCKRSKSKVTLGKGTFMYLKTVCQFDTHREVREVPKIYTSVPLKTKEAFKSIFTYFSNLCHKRYQLVTVVHLNSFGIHWQFDNVWRISRSHRVQKVIDDQWWAWYQSYINLWYQMNK